MRTPSEIIGHEMRGGGERVNRVRPSFHVINELLKTGEIFTHR